MSKYRYNFKAHHSYAMLVKLVPSIPFKIKLNKNYSGSSRCFRMLFRIPFGFVTNRIGQFVKDIED